jgi:transketolase C-terminal domain/subunit
MWKFLVTNICATEKISIATHMQLEKKIVTTHMQVKILSCHAGITGKISVATHMYVEILSYNICANGKIIVATLMQLEKNISCNPHVSGNS